MQNRMEEISIETKTDRVASIGTMREPLSTILEDSTVFASKPGKLQNLIHQINHNLRKNLVLVFESANKQVFIIYLYSYHYLFQ